MHREYYINIQNVRSEFTLVYILLNFFHLQLGIQFTILQTDIFIKSQGQIIQASPYYDISGFNKRDNYI